MSSTLAPKDWRIRLVISLFVLFNALAICLTNTELGNFPILSGIFLPYAKLTRLMQRWSLFSPEPRHYVQSYYFEMTHQNGSVNTWARPMPPQWSFFERQHAYNWQKFDTASVHMEDRSLWPDIAAWALREFADEKNPVILLKLIRKYADIPPPNQQGLPLQYDGNNLQMGDQMVFTYSVAEKRIL